MRRASGVSCLPVCCGHAEGVLWIIQLPSIWCPYESWEPLSIRLDEQSQRERERGKKKRGGERLAKVKKSIMLNIFCGILQKHIFMPTGCIQTVTNDERRRKGRRNSLSKTKELSQKHKQRQRWEALGNTENNIVCLGSEVKNSEVCPRAPVEKTNSQGWI